MVVNLSKLKPKTKLTVMDHVKAVGFVGGVVVLGYHLAFGSPKIDQMVQQQRAADRLAHVQHVAELKHEHAIALAKQKAQAQADVVNVPKNLVIPPKKYNVQLDNAVRSLMMSSSSSSTKKSSKTVTYNPKTGARVAKSTSATSMTVSQAQDTALRLLHTKQDFPSATVIGGTTITTNLSSADPYALSK